MAAKLSPDKVNLRNAKPNAARQCGSCSMFRPQSMSCTLVTGVIHPDEVCDRWEPRDGLGAWEDHHGSGRPVRPG